MIAVALAVVGSFLLSVSSPKIVDRGAWHAAVLVLRWPVAIVLLSLAIVLLLRFGPAEPRSLRWDSLGTALVVVAWFSDSVLFAWYVSSVADFRSAVGTLAAFLILTTYLYSSAIVFLVGVQLDELLREDLEGSKQGILDLLGLGRSWRRGAS